MALEKEKIYKIQDSLPIYQDLERYRPKYFPESFTIEERWLLEPFFTNLDSPVYGVIHLPEEVIAAVSSRYSRTVHSFRQTFLKEYVNPIINPDNQEDWSGLSLEEKGLRLEMRTDFLALVNFMHEHGGMDRVTNLQRARNFFDKWLAGYGDDSIAELGNVHICIDGCSNVVAKVIEDKRLGISPLERSSRYVPFDQKDPEGNFNFVYPPEIRHTPEGLVFVDAVNNLFNTYSNVRAPYVNYVKSRYPQGGDETSKSFEKSREAKGFDDIRDLLPFATQTNVALSGNGRAFEDLVNNMLSHPLGEVRWWGQMIWRELNKIVPSLVRRAGSERGAEIQNYRTNLSILRQELADQILIRPKKPPEHSAPAAELIDYTKDADILVLSTFLFPDADRLTLSDTLVQISELAPEDRHQYIAQILEERKLRKDTPSPGEVRFRKVDRSFENPQYTFGLWARGGDYRDIQRHRQLTQDRQRFTANWGYDLEKDVVESPLIDKILPPLIQAGEAFRLLFSIDPDLSQYVVPFAYIQHWYVTASAKELYHIGELRTGEQGRDHYRKLTQQMIRLAKEVSPAVFQGIMVDWGEYSLARRESEKKLEIKRQRQNL